MTDLRALIIAERDRQKLTNAELARRMATSPPAIARALRDGYDMSSDMARRFAVAMGVEWRLGKVPRGT